MAPGAPPSPGDGGAPGDGPEPTGSPTHPGSASVPSPHPPGVTLPCSLKMETGGSWGEFGGGAGCSRFEAETSSARLVKWLVNRGSVGREQGCAGMLKKQQSSRKKTPQIWSKSRGFPRGSSHIQGDTGLNNLVWESLKR